MWSPVGQQPEVPSPGQNEKKVVYGGVDYATGRIIQTIADHKSGGDFLLFLTASWHTTPYFLGPDLIFTFAWLPFVLRISR